MQILRKTENQVLKNLQTVMNTKTEKVKNLKVFWHKNRKPDLKISQHRKTENPNTPLV